MAISSAVFAAMASCTDRADIGDYVNLSVSGYVFEESGSDSIVVGVTTNAGDWSVSSDAAFIKVGEIRGDSVTIKAEKNMEDKTLSGSVTFTAGSAVKVLNVSQMPASFRGFVKVLPITARGTMSRNGEWFGWVDRTLGDDEEFHSKGYLMNTLTKEIKEIPVPADSDMEGTTADADEVFAISDDGTRLLIGTGNSGVMKYYVDGEIVPVSVPEGYDRAKPANMNADGTVLVGTVVKTVPGSTSIIHPCKWVNGDPMVLEYGYESALGKYYENGSMTYVRGCSADGSICYGSEWNTQCLQYWEEDGTLHNIGIDNLEVHTGENGMDGYTRLEMFARFWCISNDGRYIVSNVTSVGTAAAPEGIALVDTKTGSYDLIEGISDGGMHVTNDGLVFTTNGGTGSVLDFETGVSVSLSEWMQGEYGITPPNLVWVTNASYDMKAFSGRTLASGAGGSQTGFWAMRIE